MEEVHLETNARIVVPMKNKYTYYIIRSGTGSTQPREDNINRLDGA
jgi:hypothetical protein